MLTSIQHDIALLVLVANAVVDRIPTVVGWVKALIAKIKSA